jgi:hypothetical protein
MRLLALAFVLISAGTAQAGAREDRFQRSLKMLGPNERLEQLCDYTAMTHIRKDSKEYRPDRTVASAMSEPVAVGAHAIEAKGAAFRSRKKWYALSYRCTADAERLKVLSFTYKVGDEIPESRWAGYGLWE